MLGFRICLLVALVVATTSVTSAEDYVVPTGVTVLTEEQLLTQFVGNTCYTERWAEYFEPPAGNQMKGKIKAKHNAWGTYGGNWSINASLICIEYDRGPFSDYDNCYTIALDGDNATWFLTDGSTYYDPGGRIKLISGNPNNF